MLGWGEERMEEGDIVAEGLVRCFDGGLSTMLRDG